MKTRGVCIALILAWTGVAFGQNGAVMQAGQSLVSPTSTDDLAADVNKYRQHLFTLANPYMEGREPSTQGNRRAADYVQFHLSALGLEPAFVDQESKAASFRQVFVAKREATRKLTLQDLTVEENGQKSSFASGTDFNVLGYSASGSASGSVVFVGYSLARTRRDYTSYEGEVDLTGKIAMVLRFEPLNAEGSSRLNDDGWSVAASLSGKLNAAIRRNAAGIILVNPPGVKDDRANVLETLDTGEESLKVPVVMMSMEAADRLVRAADEQGRSLEDLRKLADESGVILDLPKVKVSMDAQIERVPLLTDNIGAILPGKGELADELVVIGAHYDHVGFGNFGSLSGSVGVLHPGADDNASGTSALLIAAGRLTEAYKKLGPDAQARSILFLAFGAEESGLIGSAYYANHMIRPVEKHFLMLNMDMVGRLRDGKLEVGGVATGEGMSDWLKPYWEALDMKVKTVPVGPPNSDHYSFHQKKIPNIFFFSGFHSEYHRPTDTPDLINCEGAVQIADLCCRIAFDAAQRLEPMPFSSGRGRAEEKEAQADDEDRPARPSRGNLKVRFGIAPGDYAGETKGLLIAEVIEGLPAAAAGLKTDDLITKWNGEEVDGVAGWMRLLGGHKPGDIVNITYIRGGKEATTQATLVAPAGG